MPFEDAYARLTAAFGSLRVYMGPPAKGDGWVRTADIARDTDVVPTLIAAEAAEREREHGAALRSDVAASLALHRLAWPACLLMSVPWFLERRVPQLPLESVSFHLGTGEVRVSPKKFSCLPSDPAAGNPDTWVVRDEEGLRTSLRAAVAEHLGPVLAAFQPHLRRGHRAMWGLLTDELSEGLWYLGYLFGQEERAVAELSALLPGATPPLPGAAGFRTTRTPSRASTGESYTRTRVSCCLYYTLRPDEVCATCPRACDSARLEPAGVRPGAT